MTALPETMTAIEIEGGKGPAAALRAVQVPLPAVREGEVLIKAAGAGLNGADLAQRRGLYPPPAGSSPHMGLEVSGEVVVAAGPWKVGDRVCALLGGGGYAEYVAVDARHVLPVPDHVDLVEAGGLPETVLTVFANVFEAAALKPGETLLVHGAASGIGSSAIQMGKAFGCTVIATARGAEKCAKALEFGADRAIDTTVEDFGALLEGQVDVVMELVGGDFFAKDLQAIRIGGRITFISVLGGADVQLPLRTLMAKRAAVMGSTLRNRPADEKARLIAHAAEVAWPWVQTGKVKPVVDSLVPLADAAEAHARMESSHIGKIILKA
ncbi:NAD(P)H-quinone oxidoreductase [Phenylobacterium immobile]|uniref:NAD(P)H-quinone oxidoreductase n=1 Tax=Phenylobacterium immobile TaxID=21 RepID=UPI000B2617FD